MRGWEAMRGLRAAIAVAIFAASVAVTLRHEPRTRPILADNQLYFFLAERMASGVAPHVSQVDIKTQFGTFVTAAAIAAGRPLGIDDVSSARAVAIAAVGTAAVLAWMLALELGCTPLAAPVAAAALLSMQGLITQAATGAGPKVFLVPLLLAANIAVVKRRWVGAGALSMLALLTWQPGGLAGLAALVAIAFDRRSRLLPAAARLAFGAALVGVAYEAYFAAHGALAEQWFQEFVLPGLGTRRPFDAASSVWFIASEARGWQRWPSPAPIGFALACTLGAAILALGPRRTLDKARQSPGKVAFWTAVLVGTAFTLVEHQAHPDLLLIQPYYAVACALALSWLAAPLGARLPGRAAVAALSVAALVAFGGDAWRDGAWKSQAATNLAGQKALARYLDLYRDIGGETWVVGATHLLGLARTDNHVPFGYLGEQLSTMHDFRAWRPLREGRMPGVLVVSRGIIPGGAWRPAEYNDVTPPPFARDRIRVYVRKAPGIKPPKPTPNPGARSRQAAPRPSAGEGRNR